MNGLFLNMENRYDFIKKFLAVWDKSEEKNKLFLEYT